MATSLSRKNTLVLEPRRWFPIHLSVDIERICGLRSMLSRNHASAQALPTNSSGMVIEQRRKREMSCAECRRWVYSALSFRDSIN
jgi:hypothetical protein